MTKVILTGNTGLIGGEVLSQCLSNPAITSVVALSRRDLPITHPKLQQIKHSDFTSYSPALLAELKDADACIFSLGIALPKTQEEGKRIDHDFPLAAARAFAANSEKKPFRFVYVSGALVEKDQDKTLWLMGEGRKMRGRTELELLKLNSEDTEMKVVRPGFVGGKQGSLKDTVLGVFVKIIKVDVLAAAMIDLALKGAGQEILEMDELLTRGKAVSRAG